MQKSVTLIEVSSIIAGQSPPSDTYNADGVGLPFFQGKTDFGDLYPTTRIFCSNPQKVAEKNDILLSVRAPVGPTNLAPCKVCIGRGLVAIRAGCELNQKYLLFFFRSIEKALSDSGTGTTFKAITQEQIRSIKIPLPPLPEQERIVTRIEELFSELDKGVEALQTIKAQLRVYRQAVLKETFEGLESKKATLAEVITDKPRNGYSPKPVGFPTKYKNLTLTATTGGKFIEGCCKYVELDIQDDSYLWVKHDDILIQRANTIDYVGTAAIYRGVDNVYVYPDLMMKVHTREGFDPLFILYQLQSGKTRSYFKANATGTSGSMPKINQATVMETPIVVVTYEKQLQIANLIESRLSVCDKIEQTVDESLTKAESLRQSILKKAFEGKL